MQHVERVVSRRASGIWTRHFTTCLREFETVDQFNLISQKLKVTK